MTVMALVTPFDLLQECFMLSDLLYRFPSNIPLATQMLQLESAFAPGQV